LIKKIKTKKRNRKYKKDGIVAMGNGILGDVIGV
jgi:hypothetical protein